MSPTQNAVAGRRVAEPLAVQLAWGLAAGSFWQRSSRLLTGWWRPDAAGRSLDRIGALSLKGPVRARNEDRCYTDPRLGLLLVVDGMGGYCGGVTASSIVVDAARAAFGNLRQQAAVDRGPVQAAVDAMVTGARKRMLAHAARHPECSQMGATFALGMMVPRRDGPLVYTAHMGDSRVYRVTRRQLLPLTTDETVVQALIEAGVLEPAEAQQHPMRHFVSNSLGVRPPDRWPRVQQWDCHCGDRLLLTSDGITSVLTDRQLHRLTRRNRDPQQAVAALCERAIQSGSRDNLSCVVMEI